MVQRVSEVVESMVCEVFFGLCLPFYGLCKQNESHLVLSQFLRGRGERRVTTPVRIGVKRPAA